MLYFVSGTTIPLQDIPQHLSDLQFAIQSHLKNHPKQRDVATLTEDDHENSDNADIIESVQSELVTMQKLLNDQQAVIVDKILCQDQNQETINILKGNLEKASQDNNKLKLQNVALRHQTTTPLSMPSLQSHVAKETETIKSLISVQDLLRVENDSIAKRYKAELINRKSLEKALREQTSKIEMLKDEKMALQMTITDTVHLKDEVVSLRDDYKKLYFKVYKTYSQMPEYAVCDSGHVGKSQQPKVGKPVYADCTEDSFTERHK